MADQTSYTKEEAAKAVNEYLEAGNQVRKIIDDVQDTFDAARAGWEGEAAVAGQEVARKWQQEAEDINKRLDALNQEVSEGNQELEKVDPAGVDALTNLV